MPVLSDFGPDERPVPDVNPALCHPRLALKPHSHAVCEAWLDGDIGPLLGSIREDVAFEEARRARDDERRRRGHL